MDTDSQASAQQRDLAQMDRVHINGVSAQGYHGVLTAERAQGQIFRVDVTLYLDTAPAAQTDDLAMTVNYAHVCDALVSVIEGPEVNLIETLAERLAAIVLETDLVYGVDVTVHKPQAPIAVAFDDVAIQIQRSRDNMPRVSRPFAASQIQPVASLPRWSADQTAQETTMAAREIPELDDILTAPAPHEIIDLDVPAPVGLPEAEPNEADTLAEFAEPNEVAEPDPATSVFGVVDAAALAAADTAAQANAIAPAWMDVINAPVPNVDLPAGLDLDATQVRAIDPVFSPVTEVATPQDPAFALPLPAEPADVAAATPSLPEPVDLVGAGDYSESEFSPYAPPVLHPVAEPEDDATTASASSLENFSSAPLEQGTQLEEAVELSPFAPSALPAPVDPGEESVPELAIPEQPVVPEASAVAEPDNEQQLPELEFLPEESPSELGGNDDVTQILPVITDAGPVHEPEPGTSAIIEPSPESLAIYRALRAEVLGASEPDQHAEEPTEGAQPAPEDSAPEPDIMDRVPAQPARVVIAIGANLGQPQETLQAAVEALGQITGFEVAKTGPLARTGSVGGPEDQPDYFNTVIIGYSTLSPRALLQQTQRIEDEHGRVREERWGPRTLDLDIIDFEGVIAATEDLELPHPRANQRAFVLVPWDVLDPEAYLPGLGGGPVAALAATAPDRSGIRWVALEWLTQ